MLQLRNYEQFGSWSKVLLLRPLTIKTYSLLRPLSGGSNGGLKSTTSLYFIRGFDSLIHKVNEIVKEHFRFRRSDLK